MYIFIVYMLLVDFQKDVFVQHLNWHTVIEVDIFFRQKLYRHVVDWLHLLLQDDSSEQCVDTREALLEGMLRYQE